MIMNRTHQAFLLSAVLLVLAGCDQRNDAPSTASAPGAAPVVPTAPATPSTHAGSTATLAEADRTFIQRALEGGMAEMAVTSHLREKGADGAVRETARKLHEDHERSNVELMRIAQARGATVPARPADAKRGEIEELRGLSGAELDRRALETLEATHKESIALYEDATRSAGDAELRAYAEKTLPALRQHLQMVEGLRGPGRPAAAPGAAAPPRS